MFGRKARVADQPIKPRSPASEAAKAEARANPGGWVYEIGGGYSNTEAVPPQAIKGAWKVSESGEITEEYKANPNYDPAFQKPQDSALKRNIRAALLLALLVAMAFAFTRIANVTGSVVWLGLWLTGIVTDVSNGPIWAQWLLYAPAAILYGGVIVVGFLWVRAAPRNG